MRADMGKVLVERPRVGRWRGDSRPGKGYGKRLKKCLAAGDSPPAREGIKRRYADPKSFNEHLGPLRRFLASNVGRPWDKVYAEICAHVDRGNVVQKHILTHLFQYVVTNVILVNGQPHRGDGGYNYAEPLRTSRYRHQWYVCPKSGLLRASRYVRRESQKPAPPRLLKLNNKRVCVERDGRWELLEVALLARCNPRGAPAYDAILQRHIEKRPKVEGEWVEEYGGDRFAVSRRVLTRADLLALPIPLDWLTR